jgi:hypothetical protein
MDELRNSESWKDYLCMFYGVEKDVVDMAISKFIALNDVTHDYDRMPIRVIRNEFIGYFKRLLNEDEDIIMLNAKHAYNASGTPQYERFVKILFGDNTIGLPLYNILAVKKQLTQEQLNSILPGIRGMGWEKFMDMLVAMNNKRSYTYGAVSLHALIVRWFKNN